MPITVVINGVRVTMPETARLNLIPSCGRLGCYQHGIEFEIDARRDAMNA